MAPCGRCKAPLAAADKFCSQCGARTGRDAPAAPRAPAPGAAPKSTALPVVPRSTPAPRPKPGGPLTTPLGTVAALRPPTSQRGAAIRRAMDELEDEVFDPEAFGHLNISAAAPQGRHPERRRGVGRDTRPLARRWRSRDGPADPAGRLFDASDRNVLCMAVHPDGTEAVVGSADHGLKVFALDTCKPRRNLYTKKFGHTEWVTTCCYLPDGRIVSGGMDNKLCLWAAGGLVRCEDLVGHKASVAKVLSNESGIVISASYDRTLMVWNSARGAACQQVMTGHRQPVMDFIWFHDRVVSGDREGRLRRWDVETGGCVGELEGGGGHITALGWLYDGDANVVLSGAQDGQLRVWDARAGTAPRHVAVVHPGGAVTAAAATFLAAGANLVVTAGADRAIQVLDPRAGFSPLHTLRHHRDFIYALETHDDLILSGAGDGSVLVHHAPSGECLYGLGANKAAVRCLWADASRLVAAGDDGTAAVFDF